MGGAPQIRADFFICLGRREAGHTTVGSPAVSVFTPDAWVSGWPAPPRHTPPRCPAWNFSACLRGGARAPHTLLTRPRTTRKMPPGTTKRLQQEGAEPGLKPRASPFQTAYCVPGHLTFLVGGPPPGNPAGLVRLQHHAGVGQTHRFHFVCSRREPTVSGSGLTERFPRRSSPGPSPPVRAGPRSAVAHGKFQIPTCSGTPASRPCTPPSYRQGAPFSGVTYLQMGLLPLNIHIWGAPRCTSEAPAGHHPHRPAPSGSKLYPNLNPNTSRGGTRLCLVCTQAGWNIPQGPLHRLQMAKHEPKGNPAWFLLL